MKQDKLMARLAVTFILVLLLLTTVSASSIQTGAIYPANSYVCGQYPNNVTLTAIDIRNNESVNLTSVVATLKVPLGSGLTFISNNSVSLGDISPSGTSSISPSWQIKCNDNLPGTYSVHVEYTSSNGYNGSSLSEGISSSVSVFPKDLTPPSVISHSPSGIMTQTSLLLTVSTNENAVCKYDTDSGISYDNMDNPFSVSGAGNHSTIVTGLVQGSNNLYVKCKDTAGNAANSDYRISFIIDLPPTAQVTLSEPSPLKTGVVKVTLTTSEDVVYTPQLSYSLNGATPKNIPLSGSARTWTGYIIITAEDDNKIGNFQFIGKDLAGNTGSVITNDNIFLVDTLAPSPPITLGAKSLSMGRIVLSWFYNDNTAKTFKIYKSTSPEVTKLNYYISISNTSFIDNTTILGVTYYYRVSVIDNANNEGELSNVVGATALLNVTDDILYSSNFTFKQENATGLESDNKARKEALISSIDKMSSALDNFLDQLETNDKAILNSLLTKEYRTDKVSLMNLRREIEDFKELTSENANATLGGYDTKINVFKKKLPKTINKQSEEYFKQETSATDIKNIIAIYLKDEGVSLSKSEQEAYAKEIEKLQELIKITTTVKLFKITSWDETDSLISLINKKISLKYVEDNTGLLLVESFTKEVASTSNDIILGINSEQIDSADFTLKFKLDKQSEASVNYVTKKAVPASRVENIVSVVVIDPVQFMKSDKKSSGGGITGLVVGTGKLVNFTLKNAALLGGLILAAILAFNYFNMDEKMKSSPKLNKLNSNETLKNVKDKAAKVYGHAHKFVAAGVNNIKNEISKKSQPKITKENLHATIKEAHTKVNKIDYKKGSELYKQILSNHSLISELPKDHALDLNEQLNRLHKKLTMMLRIEQGNKSMKEQNYQKLDYIANDLNRHYNDINSAFNEEEKYLMNYVKHHQELFKLMVNSQDTYGNK